MLFNVPFVLIALLFAVRLLPNDQTQMHGKFDISGLILTSMGSFVLLFAFSNLSSFGFSLPLVMGILFGFGCLIVYVWKNRRNPDALLNLGVLKYRRYVAGLLASGFVAVALYMIIFLMPLFLQNGLGQSPFMTGIIMLPASLCTILAMPIAAKGYKYFSEKKMAVVGIVVLLIGSAPFLFAAPTTPLLLIVIAMCVRCCGMGTLNLVNTNAQMSNVPAELSGHASSLTNWFSQVLNAFVISMASNVADVYMTRLGTDNLAIAYTSTTNLMMAVSCMLLIIVLPIVLKFYRGKKNN